MTHEEQNGLVEFAKEIIRASWEGCEGGDMIQELALKYGLIIETKFNPKVHEDQHGVLEAGDTWFEFSAALQAPQEAVVRVKALEWDERSGAFYAETILGEVCIDQDGDGFHVIENGRMHSEFASTDDAQAFVQTNHNRRVLDWIEPALSQPEAQAVPEGWKLVPVKPTEAMVDAHFAAHARADTVFAEVKDVWAAMLAASPATGGA